MIRVFGYESGASCDSGTFRPVLFMSHTSALLARWIILDGYDDSRDSATLAEQHDRYFRIVQQDESTFILVYEESDPFFAEFDFERAVEKAETAKLHDYLELRTDDFDARIAERLGSDPVLFDSEDEAALVERAIRWSLSGAGNDDEPRLNAIELPQGGIGLAYDRNAEWPGSEFDRQRTVGACKMVYFLSTFAGLDARKCLDALRRRATTEAENAPEATATGNGSDKHKPRRAQRSVRAETVCPA